MKLGLMSLFVDDQRAALAFYTEKLGFVTKHDIPVGTDSWITVVSPEDPDGPELLLEPAGHPAVKPYRDALMADGIPLAQFSVAELPSEVERLSALGVSFTQDTMDIGTALIAVFNDGFGNLIQLIQMKPEQTPAS